MIGAAGSAQKFDNDRLFSLTNFDTFHISGSIAPTGRNFNFTENSNGWQTGLRVFGDNMYISNRGNNNDFDSDSVFIHKVPIVNVDGTPTQQLTVSSGDANFTSIDGFDISADGTKLIFAGFHGSGGVRSASLATGFDLDSTFAMTGSLNTSPGSGIRGCSWGDSGDKYYACHGISGTQSRIYQWSAASSYIVASGDTQGTSLTVNWIAAADLTFSGDGETMWVLSNLGIIREYSLSTAWDVSTASQTNTMDISSFWGLEGLSPVRPVTNTGATPWLCGLHWSEPGHKLYVNSLWSAIDSGSVDGDPAPETVTGDGTPAPGPGPRANTFSVLEFRRK
jgi:hypothetical protein